MHAAAFTRIVPHSGVIPEALIAQAQTKGDAVAGQEQQMWLARSIGAPAKCFCCIDSLNQWFAGLRSNLALEISAERCRPFAINNRTEKDVGIAPPNTGMRRHRG